MYDALLFHTQRVLFHTLLFVCQKVLFDIVLYGAHTLLLLLLAMQTQCHHAALISTLPHAPLDLHPHSHQTHRLTLTKRE